MRIPLYAKLSAMLIVGAGAQAQTPPLSAEQLAQVERGEAVQVLQALPESPWPRSTVYQFIEATPEQSAAVLSDYALQSKYIPKVKRSKVLATRNGETDVQYVFSIPVYPDEHSISRQRVVVAGAEYRVEWHTVVDSAAKGSVTNGSATFRPWTNPRTGRTGTLMIHDQGVVPASMFARVPMVRNKAIEASREAAAAIRKQVEHEVLKDSALLQAQVTRMRATVGR
jgi:hypothetical protein